MPVVLDLPIHLGSDYKSPAQRTRAITEGWGESNLYCASCSANGLQRSRPNTKVVDFTCRSCNASYQLKSSGVPFGSRVVDAAYGAMCDAIASARIPNLLAMQYRPPQWRVESLFLIPSFALSLSAIQARKPLSANARRKGWVGCYIVLNRIPPDARISMVESGTAVPRTIVRKMYARLRPLKVLDYHMRGWTMDVLNVIRRLGKPHFSLREVYESSAGLAQLHPDNRHIQEKIRQQLQRLRDMGFIEFSGSGTYRILN